MSNYIDSLKKRFWKKIDKSAGPDGCWIWTASKNWKGYGAIWVSNGENRFIGAHVFSYMMTNGKIKEGFLVCHSCDNPACVNPKHLWLGTPKQNTQDAVNKKRMAHGENNGSAKLTEKKVIKIRKLVSKGNTQSAVAKKFGVHYSTVSLIVLNKHWKHQETQYGS